MAKKPITIYLSQYDIERLNEIYSYRLLAGEKVTRSLIFEEALNILYTKMYLMTKLDKVDRESLIDDEPEA